MQLIRKVPVSAQEYIQQSYHLKIEAPAVCPNCNRNKPPHAHDYYPRNLVVSGQRHVLSILIRRFHCHRPGCGATVTILPACVQPYRLIHNGIVEQFLKDGTVSAGLHPPEQSDEPADKLPV